MITRTCDDLPLACWQRWLFASAVPGVLACKTGRHAARDAAPPDRRCRDEAEIPARTYCGQQPMAPLQVV